MFKKVKATGRARSIYNALKKHPGVIDTQSYLRLEKQLGTQSSLTFDVLNNQGAQTVNEKRLAITDSFVITSLSIFFYTYATNVANSQEKSTLHTFPDSLVFTGAGEAASLQGFYNGFLSVRVNSVVYIDSLDLYRFYRVGVAQQGVETTTTPSNYLRSQWSNGDYGFYSLTPTIELSGATKNELTISLPSNITVTPAANHATFAVCYLRGLLRQNNAQFNPRS
jgi:hypothetical protein